MSNVIATEYSGMGVDSRTGASLPFLSMPPLAQQVLVIGSTNQLANAFQKDTRVITVYAEAACRLAIGANPDASAAGFPLAAGVEKTYTVPAGARFAVIDGAPLPTPLLTTAPVLNANVAGAAVTWVAGAAAGTPVPTLTYSLRKNDIEVATSSGAYSSTVAGDALQVVMTATNTGGKILSASNVVQTVSAAPVVPSVSAAPVLQPVAIGGQLSFSPGTFVGTPTYKVMRGATVVAASVSNGDAVPPGLAPDDQVFVRLVASSSGQTPAQADSNTVVVSAAGADPWMITSTRGSIDGAARTSGSAYSIDKTANAPVPYAQVAPRGAWTNFLASGLTTGPEVGVGNAMPIEGAAIEFTVGGVLQRYQVKFGGANAVTIADGGFAISDGDDSIVIPANTPWAWLTARALPVGQFFGGSHTASMTMLTSFTAGLQDSRLTGTTSSAATYLTGTTPLPANSGATGQKLYGPVFTMSKGWVAAGKPAVVLVQGDSLAFGANEAALASIATDYGYMYGPINRGLISTDSSTRTPFLNLAISGTSYASVTASTFVKRAQLLAAAGHPYGAILSDMGTNAGGGNAAVIGYDAYGQFLKTMSGGKPIVQTTMFPKTQSLVDNSYGYSTVANQVKNDFDVFSNYVRGLGAPVVVAGTTYSTNTIDRCLDLSGVFESSPGSGLWGPGDFSGALQADWVSTGGASAQPNMIFNASPPVNGVLHIRKADGSIYGMVKINAVAANTPSAGLFSATISQGTPSNAIPPAGTYPASTPLVEVNTIDGIHYNTLLSYSKAAFFTSSRAQLKF